MKFKTILVLHELFHQLLFVRETRCSVRPKTMRIYVFNRQNSHNEIEIRSRFKTFPLIIIRAVCGANGGYFFPSLSRVLLCLKLFFIICSRLFPKRCRNRHCASRREFVLVIVIKTVVSHTTYRHASVTRCKLKLKRLPMAPERR